MTCTSRLALVVAVSTLAAACGGSSKPDTAVIGPDGGSVATASGVTLKLAPGAVAIATEIRITEAEPQPGTLRRVELEPRGLALAVPAALSFKVEDGNVKAAEVEHGPEGEVRTELEKRRHGGEVEVEVHHLGEVELEHGLACEVDCGTGFECDDGVCKVHVEDDPATHDAGDDNGVDDPATHDVGDDHGVDPAPAPTTCPDGMELDASDGICKPHGGSGGGSSGP
jgi:hypothetical protein